MRRRNRRSASRTLSFLARQTRRRALPPPEDPILADDAVETKYAALGRFSYYTPESRVVAQEIHERLRRLSDKRPAAAKAHKRALLRAYAERGTWTHLDVWMLCRSMDDLDWRLEGGRGRGTALAARWRAWRVRHVYGDSTSTEHVAHLEDCSQELVRRIRRRG